MSYRTVDREQAITNRGLLNSRTFSNIKQSTGGKPPEKVGASWQQTRRHVSQKKQGHWKKCPCLSRGPPRWLGSRESACNAGDPGEVRLISRSGGSPGEGKATHSSVLAWRIPWTEELGGLQSMGSQRVGHD